MNQYDIVTLGICKLIFFERNISENDRNGRKKAVCLRGDAAVRWNMPHAPDTDCIVARDKNLYQWLVFLRGMDTYILVSLSLNSTTAFNSTRHNSILNNKTTNKYTLFLQTAISLAFLRKTQSIRCQPKVLLANSSTTSHISLSHTYPVYTQ